MSSTGAGDETPEIHTIANLSPVSPSPLTTTTISALPTLQSQADFLDDAGVAQANSISSMTDSPTVAAFAIAAGQRSMLGGDNDADADADLDDDLYGESEQEASTGPVPPAPTTAFGVEPEMDDEYAKTFDSPINGENDEEAGSRDSDMNSEGSAQATESRGTELSHASTPLFASNVPEPPKSSHARDHNTVVAAAATTHLSPSSMALSFADIPMTGPDLPVQLSPGSLAATMNLNASSDADASNEQARSLTSSGDDGMKALGSLVSTTRDPTEADDLSQTPTGGVSANGALMLPPASADLPSRPSVDMNRIPLDVARAPTAPGAPKAGPPPSPSAMLNTHAPGAQPPSSLPPHAPGHLPPPPPGTTESMAALGPPPGPTNPSLPQVPPIGPASAGAPGTYSGAQNAGGEPASPNYHRMWDRYVADEKRYMAEQKWDRFPEGSRVFIGNLSSDKVTKRDVFALFHRFGRLAQISLKSAFGFVQYHTLEEAQAAVENLQGVEVKGRKIHLEFSRTQKKKDAKEERARSPDRGPRGREAANKGNRHDSGQPGRRSRDEPRQGGHSRQGSDHRSHRREESYGRDRQYENYRSRDRSMSPRSRGRDSRDRESYRKRSRSPYNTPRHGDDSRPYGQETPASPDVQLLLLQEVDPNFVNWVRGAFIERGLRTDVMIVNPAYHIKKDIISRLVVDGVCGIVELDFKGQDRGEVYLHLYDLSRGLSNVSFNEYQGLKPATAADLVSRTKSKPPYQTAQPSYGSGPQTGFYSQPPATQPMIPAAASAYHHGQPGPGAYPQAPTHASAPAPAGVDLQQILSQLQKSGLPQPGTAAPASAPSAIDIQAILGQLKGGSAPLQSPQAGYPSGGTYASGPGPNPATGFGQGPSGPAPIAPGARGTDAQVQNIMAQLARFRQ